MKFKRYSDIVFNFMFLLILLLILNNLILVYLLVKWEFKEIFEWNFSRYEMNFFWEGIL